MKDISLDTALESILDAVKDRLESEKDKLGVKNVILGNRNRNQPTTPSIWIFSDVASVEDNPRTLAERWTLPVSLVAVVKDSDPEKGHRRAMQIASRARTVIIRDRTLGLRDFVQDTQSFQFETSSTAQSTGGLHGAVATLRVIFMVYEKPV